MHTGPCIVGYTISPVSKFHPIGCNPIRAVSAIDFIYIICQYNDMGSVFTLRAYDVRIPHDLLTITVLDEATFLHNIQWPFNIVGTEDMNTLYFADDHNDCIWKMDTVSNKVTEWLSELYNEFSLSIANDDHLLVLKTSKQLSNLEIFDQDAKLVKRVSLPKDFKGPCHAIQKPDGDFIVSHKLRQDDGFCISFLSADGQIVRQFKLKETVGFKYTQYFEINNSEQVAAEMVSGIVYMYDYYTWEWNLSDLRVIISNRTDESSRKIVGFRNTDGRIFSYIEEVRHWHSLQLFWDTKSKNLLVAEDLLGDWHLFDTKTLRWSQIGRRPHFALSYDTKTKTFIVISGDKLNVETLSLTNG